MSEWRDISTAPRDGTQVLLFPHMVTAHWDFGDDEWMIMTVPLNKDGTIAEDWSARPVMWFCVYANIEGYEPTYWQPLPEPPERKAMTDSTEPTAP